MPVTYCFDKNQGIGANAISPHAQYSHEDIVTAVTMGMGSILVIFRDGVFQAAIRADEALVRFAFENAYPICLASKAPDVAKMARIGYRFWIRQRISAQQLERAQRYFKAKYHHPHMVMNAEQIAAERLMSDRPITLASAICVSGLYRGNGGCLIREEVADRLKREIRRLLK